MNEALEQPLKGIFGKLRGHVATAAAASQIGMVNRSLIRTANLHRWLISIAGDLHWDKPLLCDALLETYYWMVGPMLAIDPERLQPSNDHVA